MRIRTTGRMCIFEVAIPDGTADGAAITAGFSGVMVDD